MSERTFETLTREEFAARLTAQGVSREHLAFRCWMCGTVQSLRSFELAGVALASAEYEIGYSCVGRHTGAGAWDAKNPARRAVPGCNWGPVGFFRGGAIKLLGEGGRERWSFAVATPDEARALMGRGGRIEAPALERADSPQTAADIPGQPQTASAIPAPAPTSRRRRTRAPEAP